jgi:hypothetical protein
MIGWWLRTRTGDALLVATGLGIGGFSIWFIQVVPIMVATVVLLPLTWFGMKKAHGVASRLNGINPETGVLESGGGHACSNCLTWCLRSTDLDEPCNCPCPDHDWEDG